MQRFAILTALLTLALMAVPAIADDETPPEESLFDTLDADKNGRLTSAEIPEEQSRYFRRLVRVGDENGDNELTREEFENATRDDVPVDPPATREAGRNRPFGVGAFMPIDQLFDQYDANDDDKLTLEEIPERIRPRLEPMFQGREEVTREQLSAISDRSFGPDQVAGLMRRLDGDGDGRVRLNEVPEFLRPRLEPVFEKLGADEVDVERVAQALQQADRTRPAAEGRAPGGRPAGGGPAFLRILDEDGDGGISREELTAAGEKFDELDQNGDDQIDAPELFGFPRDSARPESGRPATERSSRRPQRPEGSDGQRRRPAAEDGDNG